MKLLKNLINRCIQAVWDEQDRERQITPNPKPSRLVGRFVFRALGDPEPTLEQIMAAPAFDIQDRKAYYQNMYGAIQREITK